ncbi:zinc-dependent metalloprotease [Myxococcus sp. CA051A]|uniref:zinc-dependent metalloprotease n=1 Tax=Myxococcus sp. CA051A TaxID=2741739 RepID=UPI00157B7992|nr:zinc-dependent metalloprotease [Myxococcus sp. CA051A]NTX67228.1 zinc-dependent metalloprotease [Myxococcus sp. CA051A]
MRRWHFAGTRVWAGILALTWVLSTGCSEPRSLEREPEGPGLDLVLGEDIVEVPRQLSSTQRAQVTQKLEGVVDPTGRTFYLAIRRSELSQRWFMSGFLRQLHPGGADYGAAQQVGTRVVRFQEQNGKLFVFDARDGLDRSDPFRPDVLVDAFPIVTDFSAFHRLPGSEQYVLFDPAAGLNRIGFMGDHWYGSGAIDFQIELSFAQRFRRISDGVLYEHVIRAYTDDPIDSAEILEVNALAVSATLSMGLRKYKEGAGFKETPLPEQELFIRSDGRFIRNTTTLEQVAIKMHIHPGMKPIRWYITDTLLMLKDDPRYVDADLVGAIKRGIEGWNALFGYKAFEALLGGGDMDLGDDDKNVFIYDPVDSIYGPYAYATRSVNPNTGEVRSGRFYFNSNMMHAVEAFFDDDLLALAQLTAPKARPPLRLARPGLARESECEFGAELFHPGPSGQTSWEEDDASATPLTKTEKVERYLTYVSMHEVGHTMGLRHNLMGSLVYDGTPATPRSSTVMDRADMLDTVYLQTPGSYDVAAVRYLYGLSPELPTDLFCTEDAYPGWEDPACVGRDRFDDPLTRWFTPNWQAEVAQVLRGAPGSSSFQRLLQHTGDFVRSGAESARVQAYDALMQKVRPPLQVPAGEGAAYAARADELARRILVHLHLETYTVFTKHPYDPLSTPLYTQALHADLRGILLNVDGVRGFRVRRVMVDILKDQQTLAAYGVLQEVHTELTARLPTLSGEERLGTMELLGRIEVARSPYFR